MTDLITDVKAKIAEGGTGTEAALSAGWNRVCDKIQERALAKRPKPRVFEVHHETETARKKYLESFAAGHTVAACEAFARNAIGLGDA